MENFHFAEKDTKALRFHDRPEVHGKYTVQPKAEASETTSGALWSFKARPKTAEGWGGAG